MVKYVFVVKDIIHPIVERSSIISDDVLETISTSIGHMIAVKDIIQGLGKASVVQL